MKRMIMTMTLALAMVMSYAAPSVAGETYLGQVSMFAGTYPPPGYKFCDGQLLNIKDNRALYGLLEDRYGGDNKKTFALPDLSEAEETLDGVRYIIAVKGLFPAREH